MYHKNKDIIESGAIGTVLMNPDRNHMYFINIIFYLSLFLLILKNYKNFYLLIINFFI